MNKYTEYQEENGQVTWIIRYIHPTYWLYTCITHRFEIHYVKGIPTINCTNRRNQISFIVQSNYQWPLVIWLNYEWNVISPEPWRKFGLIINYVWFLVSETECHFDSKFLFGYISNKGSGCCWWSNATFVVVICSATGGNTSVTISVSSI